MIALLSILPFLCPIYASNHADVGEVVLTEARYTMFDVAHK